MFRNYKNKFILIISVICIMMGWVYSFGWGGGLHLDDAANLSDLKLVFADQGMNFIAAADFIFSGNAGPLGRSISLASFLVDGSGWPTDVRAFLYTNTLLHLINGLLVFLFLFQMGLMRSWPNEKALMIAVVSSAFWVVSPLHASAVLMPIQRMTLISNLFMILGMWLYLKGRARIGDGRAHGIFIVIFGLFIGLIFGALAKEQAVLISLFLLVIEIFWLSPFKFSSSKEKKVWIVIKIFGLYLPAAIIIFNIVKIFFNAELAYSTRNFTLEERLWTQAVVLWDYVRLGFFPRAQDFGPFHDDFPLYRGGGGALLALATWVFVIFLAIFWRKKAPFFIFGLSWFFVTHIIESTTIPLEMYFEHRNYAAFIVPWFLIVTFMVSLINNKKARLFIFGFGFYFLLHIFSLWQTVSIFGNTDVAAIIWHERHPESMRATQYLAQKKINKGDVEGALKLIEELLEGGAKSSELALQALQLGCALSEDEKKLLERLNLARSLLIKNPQIHSMTSTLENLRMQKNNAKCLQVVNGENLKDIAFLALNNEKISSGKNEAVNLNIFLSLLYFDERDIVNTSKHIEYALKIRSNIKNLQLGFAIFMSAGLNLEAERILNEYPPVYSKNPWVKYRQQQEINKLRGHL